MKRSADWEPCVNRPKSCPEPVESCVLSLSNNVALSLSNNVALSLSNGASRRFDMFT